MGCIALLIFVAVVESWQMSALSLMQNRQTSPKCVVWHSQHKSAGMNIELMLSHRPLKGSGVNLEDWQQCRNCTYICDRETWDCEGQTCDHDKSYMAYDPKQYPSNLVAYRGYTPRLVGRSPWGTPGDGRCVWATMSREPIHRLVSAYMWCKVGEGRLFDPLCGARSQDSGHGLNVGRASIREFAKHWGNFLMRELMWNPALYEIAKSRPEFQSDDIDCLADPWVQFKLQLNGGDNIRTESGKKNLIEIENRILAVNGRPPLYDVWGVVEKWNSTMAMFDTFMPLEWGYTWLEETNSRGGIGHGSHSYKEEELKVLEDAKRDAWVQEYIAGDLYLYNKVILPMFNRKLSELYR